MKSADIAIDIQNLAFRWPGSNRNLLEIDSFKINSGQKVFLQGPSGSGKTTLLNLIAGVLNFSEGQIQVLGEDFKKLDSSQKDFLRGNKMGFVFQLFNLLPFLTVSENIMLPLEFSPEKKKKVKNPAEETKRLLEQLEMDPRKYLNRKVTDLSVGQQQRVAVARALIGSPTLLIADEPTSSLDQDVRDQFLKLLFKESLASKTTILFVSHDVTLQKNFDQVLSLKTLNKRHVGVEQ